MILTNHLIELTMMKRLYVFCASAALILSAACSRSDDSAATDRTKEFKTDIYREIRKCDRLVLASMSVTKTAVTDDSKLWGKKIGVYSYDTYLRASVDLSQLTPEDIVYDDGMKSVSITLPPVDVDLSGRDMTMREEYTDIGLLRSRFDSKDRARAKEEANRHFRQELKRDNSMKDILTGTAEKKARDYFESFFAKNGYTATVKFK